MLAAREWNAREKWPPAGFRRLLIVGAAPPPRLRGGSSRRSTTDDRARGGRLGLAENLRRGHFFLAMPKTWPYIQKNRTREFFASEKRTERRERVQALGR